MNNAPNKKSRWLLSAIIAFIVFIGGVASNLVATDLEALVPSYRYIIWGIFGLALVVTVVLAVQQSRDSINDAEKQSALSAGHNRSVTIDGNVESSTIITGDHNETAGSK